MRASHRQHVAALQHVGGQPFGPAGVGRASVQDRLHQRVLWPAVCQMRPRHHIAHHKHIGAQGQLVSAVALHQLNAQASQLVAHRRVHAGVATGDPVAGLDSQRGQAAHEGAANSQNVYVHGGYFRRGRVGC